MANREADYWRGRFVQVEEAAHKTALERLDALDAAYREAGREIEREMSVWYQRFATNNGITLREAKQWLNAGELKEFKWSVQDYIKHGQENNLSGAWMKELENASARFHVSRLQALQITGQQVVEKLFGGQLDGLDETMRQAYLTGYTHSAFEIQKGIGLGWNVGRIDERALDKVITRPWTMDGRNFSDRIWTNKAALTAELQKQLSQNLMLGKSPEDSIQAIMGKFNVSHHQAERLVLTESAYFSSLSQQQCYRDLGVENYQIVATLDERTSDICQSMDGQTFSVKDYEPGVTAPPFHPYCRTATCPYYADMKGVGERAARDPDTGKTYHVPKDMTYPEWKKTFAAGQADPGLKGGNGSGIIEEGKILATCTTVKQVEQLMKDQKWFSVQTLGGKVYDTNETLTLEGCDLDIAKGVYEAHEQLFTKYPQLIGKLNSVGTGKLASDVYAQCSVGWGRGGVTLNKINFGSLDKLVKSYARDVASGYHCVGTDWVSIVTHELGHAVDDYLTNTLHCSGMVNSWKSKYVSADLRPKVMKAAGLRVGEAFREVSGYASKDHFEWFAECFAEFMRSPTPRNVATQFGKMFDVIMKGVK